MQDLDQAATAGQPSIDRPGDRVDQPPPKLTSPTVLRRAAREPVRAFRVLLALAKGHVYRVYFRARGLRFRAGRNFRVFGTLSVRGPGEVVFGDNVAVYGRTTPWTYSREARIVVGDNVNLGPVEFGCVREIRIGSGSVVGRCGIMDTD